jgi:hypothetical protein
MDEAPTILDTVEDESVTDPLTEVTRRERKALLATCVIGLAISAGGLVPDKIETFGVSITPDQESLLYIIGGVTAYFVVAFAVYAWSDLKRREARAARRRERLRPLHRGCSCRVQEDARATDEPRRLGCGQGDTPRP